jgi:integrase
MAWDIIAAVPRRNFNEHLFGKGKEGFNNWSVPKIALDKRSGVMGWTIHDLRRTTATGMADLGVQPHVIEAVLNHVSGHKRGVAGIYNRSTYGREMKTALALWADHVASITTDTERKIIPIREVSA